MTVIMVRIMMLMKDNDNDNKDDNSIGKKVMVRKSLYHDKANDTSEATNCNYIVHEKMKMII